MNLIETPTDETSTPTGALIILSGLCFPPIPEFNDIARFAVFATLFDSADLALSNLDEISASGHLELLERDGFDSDIAFITSTSILMMF
jgi:hypothetical protein